jgi:predicted flavoprotein YhiN
MNVNLTPDEAKLCKSIFSDFQEENDRKSEIAAEMTATKKKFGQVIDCKPGEAGKILTAMLKMYEDGNNPLDDMCTVIDVIKNDGSQEDASFDAAQAGA